jgi:hypothetical protein
MPDPQAQRTLVKSPPELWAEVSDVEALTKHLGEFGEIRITRLEPETTVVWEGDRASGTVRLEPSGWGTKVTLTATPVGEPAAAAEPEAPEEPASGAEAAEPDLAAVAVAEPEPEAPAAVAEPGEPAAVAERDAPVAVGEPDEPVAVAEREEPVAEPEAAAHGAVSEPEEPAARAEPEDTPEPKRGLLARLFGRRAKQAPVSEQPADDEAPMRDTTSVATPVAEIPSPAPPAPAPGPPTPTPDPIPDPLPDPVPEPLPPEPDPVPDPLPDPVPEPFPPEPDPVPEPQIAALDEDTVVGVLTGVLDDLGSAHHRPFSR